MPPGRVLPSATDAAIEEAEDCDDDVSSRS